VYCAAVAKISRDLDQYGVLQIDTADDMVITKNYDGLSYWLDPDRNTLPGAEAAFKFVSEAHAILRDPVK
jgi:DnaJ-class molecular chaperone